MNAATDHTPAQLTTPLDWSAGWSAHGSTSVFFRGYLDDEARRCDGVDPNRLRVDLQLDSELRGIA